MLSALAEDRARIADLDAIISEMERSICALRVERELAQERLQSYKYPVLTLPNEVVSEIFLHFLPIYPRCPPLTGILSPTLLTLICRSWRDVALATPVLWRAISSSDTSEIPFAKQLEMSVIWLNRSRSCPLSFQMADGQSLSTHDEMTALLSTIIIPHHRRWEHLKLGLLPHSCLPAIASGPMPLLRHLDLALVEASDVAVVTVAFLELPLLRTAIVDCVTAAHAILPWAQLTSLSLDRVYPHECVPVLKQTPNLVHCTLWLFFFYGDDSSLFDELTLPCLEALTINNPGHVRVRVMKFLAKFNVPALRTLQIPERCLGPDIIRSLASFISNSGCKLNEGSICITGARTISEEAYRMAFPSIAKFCFTGQYHFYASEEMTEESSSEVEDDDD
ncbi:F-box domain-containing protein [Mycena venus]|uniref:F-box domain-containing protein n=1 Tax=Mycena venus TaxID=2733690 RepID=A0A8H6X4Y9_9AGAR|nr:F-box domain-containing protein [Mycena venus]